MSNAHSARWRFCPHCGQPLPLSAIGTPTVRTSVPRAYTVAQICVLLQFNTRTFFRLRQKGQLPFLSELRPRLGRVVRYRADFVDRYLAGQWDQPRSFSSHRRPRR